MRPPTPVLQYYVSGSYHRRKKISVFVISLLIVTMFISTTQFAGIVNMQLQSLGNIQQFAASANSNDTPPCIQQPAQQEMMNATNVAMQLNTVSKKYSCGHSGKMTTQCKACGKSAKKCGGDCFWNPRLQRCQLADMKAFVDCGNKRSAENCSSCGTSESVCGGQCKWANDHCCSVVDDSVQIVFTTEQRITYLHELMQIVTRILNEKNIPYFLISGTLLGAMRNRPPGLFRWDDDIDIGVKGEYYADMHAAMMAHPRIVSMKKAWGGYAYGLKDAKKERNSARCALDIFKYAKMNHSTFGYHWYIIQEKAEETYFPNEFVEDWEIDVLRPCSFWDMHDLKCLNESRAVMKRYFGKDVFTRSVIYNHHNTKKMDLHMDKTNINEHLAFLPALNKPLAKKLLPASAFDSEDDFGWDETESKNNGEASFQVSMEQD